MTAILYSSAAYIRSKINLPKKEISAVSKFDRKFSKSIIFLYTLQIKKLSPPISEDKWLR